MSYPLTRFTASETLVDGAPVKPFRNGTVLDTALTGFDGFAGVVDEHAYRDVLGRRPLFREAESSTWAFVPRVLDDPIVIPPGYAGPLQDASPDASRQTPPRREALDAHEAQKRVTDVIQSEILTDRVYRSKTSSGDEFTPAVAFSGGIDSSIVALSAPEAPCYVAGFPNSHDRTAARSAATILDRSLTEIELTHETIISSIEPIVTATGRSNPMDLAIAIPLYVTAKRVAEDGHTHLLLGQGADELFGGYAKVANAADDPRVEADTIREARYEMILSIPSQAIRDVLAIRAGGVEPLTPFLSDTVIQAALTLPGVLIATSERRKIALRDALTERLSNDVRTRDKKAVQYGTYVARELDRLARQAGFKRRMDNHVQQYIDHLIDE